MSLLSDLNVLLSPLVPIETGVFSGAAPDRYAVVTPMNDSFELFADNVPNGEIQEARISVYDKGAYTVIKNEIVRLLLSANITITDRRYIGHEDDTGYHHYAIDVANNYELED